VLDFVDLGVSDLYDAPLVEGYREVKWTGPRDLSSPLLPGGTINVSWGGSAPARSFLDIDVAARIRGKWSGWFELARWTSEMTETVRRISHGKQTGPFGQINVDTYENTTDYPVNAWQVRVKCYGSAKLDWLTVQGANPQTWRLASHSRTTRRIKLGVPVRSQYEFRGGEAWCGAVSALGILEYFGVAPRRRIADVVSGVYDETYDGTGNWSFLAAYLSTHLRGVGKRAFIQNVASMRDVELYLLDGNPVIASLAWDNTSPDARMHLGNGIPKTDGHLMVVDGVHGAWVLVQDPATVGSHAMRNVSRRYLRDQFECRLSESSNGTIIAISDL
jgi:hypothetical protein